MVLALVALGTGCVSARMSERQADRAFRDGRYDEAADRLKQGYEKHGESGVDSLLYLLDIGLSQHSAGHYDEAIKTFLKADRLAEIKDYTSLATEGATLLTSDNIKSYKGEDFENVLISTYLAMDYALIGDRENALVEARRVNRKLYLMVTEGQRKYKQNAFARYLSGILYEADGDWNNAYVDYKQARELEPEFPGLCRDLWRMASLLRMSDEAERWQSECGLGESELAAARATKAEIVVLYENGISPVKRPNPQFYSLPKFFPRYNPVRAARVLVDGSDRGATAILHDIESTAIENLEEKYGALVAKKVAGVVVKEVVGYEVERATKSPLLGALTKLAFYASDQADVRSWNLLPRDLQVLRIPVGPGQHVVRVAPVGASTAREKVVQVRPGQKVFVNFRYMP